MKNLFILVITLFVSSFAQADVLVDFGANYSAETFHTSADKSNTEYFYNFDVLFNLDNRKRWNLGWTFFGISQNSVVGSSTSNYASMDMGPALRWNIDKNGIYSTTIAYGYLARGTYAVTGSPDEKWEGTSLFAQISAQYPLREEKFYIGLSLNYYAANYSVKTINNVESSNDAQKTWIFPMLSFSWRQ